MHVALSPSSKYTPVGKGSSTLRRGTDRGGRKLTVVPYFFGLPRSLCFSLSLRALDDYYLPLGDSVTCGCFFSLSLLFFDGGFRSKAR
jgi:hypothetical protein